jgi:uncharacterized membrane protein (UPF0127 family)
MNKLALALALACVLALTIALYSNYESFIINKKKTIHINIIKTAKTPKQHARGLMYVKEKLPVNSGMLFIYPRKTNSSFWMKNTFIDLDIVFMDENKKVVGTIENMKAHDLTSRSIDKPYTYAIEMNAGSIKNLNIKVNDIVNYYL